jgi:hypothetical protein
MVGVYGGGGSDGGVKGEAMGEVKVEFLINAPQKRRQKEMLQWTIDIPREPSYVAIAAELATY